VREPFPSVFQPETIRRAKPWDGARWLVLELAIGQGDLRLDNLVGSASGNDRGKKTRAMDTENRIRRRTVLGN
jgi:hypothetical protein